MYEYQNRIKSYRRLKDSPFLAKNADLSKIIDSLSVSLYVFVILLFSTITMPNFSLIS